MAVSQSASATSKDKNVIYVPLCLMVSSEQLELCEVGQSHFSSSEFQELHSPQLVSVLPESIKASDNGA